MQRLDDGGENVEPVVAWIRRGKGGTSAVPESEGRPAGRLKAARRNRSFGVEEGDGDDATWICCLPWIGGANDRRRRRR
jgi:hypothetical protein